MTAPSKLPRLILNDSPWGRESQAIWLTTAFVLHRNLASSHFPAKCSLDQLERQLSMLNTQIQRQQLFSKAHFLKSAELSALDKEFLSDHYLLQSEHISSSVGTGVVIDESGCILCLLNEADHLIIRMLDFERRLDETWTKLSTLDNELHASLGFAYNPKFGFLSADSELCGTGLKVYVYLHLPALIHANNIQEALHNDLESGVEAFSLEGSLESFLGDVIVLTNRCSIGVSEENILKSVHISATKLMASERAMRTYLSTHRSVEIKDQVARAFGLLMHSYQLQTSEALEGLSLVKLGLDLGWIKGVTSSKLNELFFLCRRSHLRMEEGIEEKDLEELPRKRAEFIHKNLQGLELLTEKKHQ